MYLIFETNKPSRKNEAKNIKINYTNDYYKPSRVNEIKDERQIVGARAESQ